MQAGFATIDITPPLGTHKVGWLKDIVPDHIADPIEARVAVFRDDAGTTLAIVQLDTLSVRWSDVRDIRARLTERYGIPAGHVMVAATHNHGGPAIATIGKVDRDAGYVETLKQKVVTAVGEALAALAPAELGFGRILEYGVSHNRRVVQRDGLVKTHGNPRDPQALHVEGPIDPEVAVIAARRPGGELLGAIVNFACHPTHHGGDQAFSGGWPAALCRELQRGGIPGALFLNGACGNLSPGRPADSYNPDHLEIGARLAEDARTAIAGMTFCADWPLSAASVTVALPYRQASTEEIAGALRGAQRFVDPKIYDEGMPRLLDRIATRREQPAEVQRLSLGDVHLVSIPAEYFVEEALLIKEAAAPATALVSSCTNGMVGYVPTAAAFARGGYETTFALSSRQSPGAGAILRDAAIGLIRQAPAATTTP